MINTDDLRQAFNVDADLDLLSHDELIKYVTQLENVIVLNREMAIAFTTTIENFHDAWGKINKHYETRILELVPKPKTREQSND